jgi:indolepyruvate decarboxylase
MATVAQYLIDRIRSYGAEHVFGVPGDFVLTFFKRLEDSPLKVVNTCDEQGAGFAADVYGRIRGLGVVVVTYTVGGFKVINTTAEAFAEKSPVLIISGAPGIKERANDPLLHHRVDTFDTQKWVFEHITAASAVISSPHTAASEIDRLLHVATTRKRPVYLEIPRDMVDMEITPSLTPVELAPEADPLVLHEAINELEERVNTAQHPVILAGVEIHRFRLQPLLLKFAEKTQIPVATTILGKSVIPESHPLYMGVYEGAMSRPGIQAYMEKSDCVLMLGALRTDINLGIYTSHFEESRVISVSQERTSMGFHQYEHISIKDVMAGLANATLKRRPTPEIPRPQKPATFLAEDKQVSVNRMFECLNHMITGQHIILADPGDALFGAAQLVIEHETRFIAPAYYASLGFSVPGSIGAQLALPKRRTICLVGDGAFQMTGMELSTSIRFGLNPIVVILNNNGYGTERPMVDGPFNDVLNWHYEKICEVLGSGTGIQATSEKEFQQAMKTALADDTQLYIVNVHLDDKDISEPLRQLTEAMGKKV